MCPKAGQAFRLKKCITKIEERRSNRSGVGGGVRLANLVVLKPRFTQNRGFFFKIVNMPYPLIAL